MTAETFELIVSLPRDARFVETARALAVHAAQFAGCQEDAAQAFGRAVEAAVHGCVAGAHATAAPIPLVVRRAAGPVEVLIDGSTLRVDV